ncbi:MAG: hypothetical protein GF365_02940 [Candidatus Buchananbacteria bacterium]|nr:hypothetical protein [Candidatus Buchananbacteria bacterium]
MHKQFHVNIVVNLVPLEDKAINICEIPAIVEGEFAINLSDLFIEALFVCTRQLKTSKLSIVSLKIMPVGDKVKLTINALLNDDINIGEREQRYKKVEFTQASEKVQKMDLHRLIKYMEAKAMVETGKKFKSLLHLRVIPFEADDVKPEHF